MNTNSVRHEPGCELGKKFRTGHIPAEIQNQGPGFERPPIAQSDQPGTDMWLGSLPQSLRHNRLSHPPIKELSTIEREFPQDLSLERCSSARRLHSRFTCNIPVGVCKRRPRQCSDTRERLIESRCRKRHLHLIGTHAVPLSYFRLDQALERTRSDSFPYEGPEGLRLPHCEEGHDSIEIGTNCGTRAEQPHGLGRERRCRDTQNRRDSLRRPGASAILQQRGHRCTHTREGPGRWRSIGASDGCRNTVQKLGHDPIRIPHRSRGRLAHAFVGRKADTETHLGKIKRGQQRGDAAPSHQRIYHAVTCEGAASAGGTVSRDCTRSMRVRGPPLRTKMRSTHQT